MNKKNQDWNWTTSADGASSSTSTFMEPQIKHDFENEQVHFKSEDPHPFNDFALNSNLHAYDEAYFNFNKDEHFMMEEEDVEGNLNGYNNYYINDDIDYDDDNYQEPEYNYATSPPPSEKTTTKPIVRRGRKPKKNFTTSSTPSSSAAASSKTVSRDFDCPFCSHISSTQVSRETHLKSHIEGKCHAYTCSLCPSATKKAPKVFWPTMHEWLCHMKKCHLTASTVKRGRPKNSTKKFTPTYKPLGKKKYAINRSQLKDVVQTTQNDDDSGRRSKRLKQKPRIKFNLLAKGKLKPSSSLKEKTDSSSSISSKSTSTQELKIQSSQKMNIKKKEKVEPPPPLVFKCREKDCHAIFSTFDSRKTHEESDHVKVHCPMPDCLSVFNIISALRDHMLHEHDIELPPEFESEIQEEEQKHPQRQRLSTPTISKPTIKTTTTINNNNNNNNNNSKLYPMDSNYKCEYCGSEYRAKHFYDKHLETHTLPHRVKEVPQRSPSSSQSVNVNANVQSTIVQSRNKSRQQNFIVIVTPMTSSKK